MSETRPLLPQEPLPSQAATPLPIRQLTLLFLIRMTDPLCFCVIFPFISQMLLEIGNVEDVKTVGFKAGLVSGLDVNSQPAAEAAFRSSRASRSPNSLRYSTGDD